MKANVFFIATNHHEALNLIQQKISKLCDEVKIDECIESNDFVAIKIHFGEKGNDTHIPANYLPPITSKIKNKGAKPFLTDTNVLYKSSRTDSVSHLILAESHGFTLQNCGAPIIITDGLRGDSEIEVEINGKIFQKVSIATEAVTCHALIVLTHVTGHLSTGIGGTLKNLGMGLASRKGKLRQHSSIKPWIDKLKCTGCKQCLIWCPANAIVMDGNIANIKTVVCIGCAECITVCRYDAVRHNWKTSSVDLQRRIAEHALGAVIHKRSKTAYFNFLINVTKDCDCLNMKQTPIIPDIGILASKDPVAIDQASLDLIHMHSGKTLRELAYPSVDETTQLEHAQNIGLGNRQYELIELQ